MSSDENGNDNKDKNDSFASFGDLLAHLGGSDENDADNADETSVDEAQLAGEDVDDEEEDAAAADATPREIILHAKHAFGPMGHGPPCYQDVESEEMEILASFRVRTHFPKSVLQTAADLPDDPPASDFEDDPHRLDLRGERIFTVDSETARDFDDAIAIKETDDGWEVGVHIADVSHYVRPGTVLDREAMIRGTSVYLADQVSPMLPESLSNRLCSLMPDRDRLAFSVVMNFDKKGRRTGMMFSKSVIRSFRRCTYKGVQALLDGESNDETARIADLEPDLQMFAEWTRKRQALRDARGSFRMQSGERKFRFDEKGEVVGVYRAATYFSQTLIEETALAANQAVGDFFKANGLPTIYRVHPEKDPDEIAATIEMLEKFGIRAPKKDRITGRDIGAMVRFARRQQNAETLIARIMGLMERAVYEVQSKDDTAEHFGLATEHYLHFTSPIRRYPDLIVHRMLFEVLRDGQEGVGKLSDPERLENLTEVAAHSSGQAEVAKMVEIAIEDLKLCQFMEERIDEEGLAKVTRVSRFGIEIELQDEYVTGFVPSSTIGRVLSCDGPQLVIRARQGGSRSFREGDTVAVKVKDVDFVRLRVIFELPAVRKS